MTNVNQQNHASKKVAEPDGEDNVVGRLKPVAKVADQTADDVKSNFLC